MIVEKPTLLSTVPPSIPVKPSEKDVLSGGVQCASWPGYYITRTGDVYTYPRGSVYPVRGRVYGGERPTARRYVLLYRSGKRQMVHVDRLVAEAYVPVECSTSGSLDVEHKNGKLNDDSFDNLKWVRKSKCYYTSKKRGRPKAGKSRLSEDDVCFMRFMYDHGIEGAQELTDLYPGVTYSMITKIVLRFSWKESKGYGCYRRTVGT